MSQWAVWREEARGGMRSCYAEVPSKRIGHDEYEYMCDIDHVGPCTYIYIYINTITYITVCVFMYLHTDIYMCACIIGDLHSCILLLYVCSVSGLKLIKIS